MTFVCTKRGYLSAKEAKNANKRARFRLRAYHCANCKHWHVTNAEKSERY